MAAQSIPPLQVLAEPLRLAGGLRMLVHGDPTFMVMDNLKRQFEQVVGTDIHQRAFSIDRLHQEALRNAERKHSRYDIIAVDLPWIGEFAEKGVLMPLDEVMDIDGWIRPISTPPAGARPHWGGVPYGVPEPDHARAAVLPQGLFAEPAGAAGNHDDVIAAAKSFPRPAQGRYGMAWNAARGTALGHTFMMTCADFGQPVIDLPGGRRLRRPTGSGKMAYRPMIDTDRGLAAAPNT
jgi:multiple sugar transport system substrate-binding protein